MVAETEHMETIGDVYWNMDARKRGMVQEEAGGHSKRHSLSHERAAVEVSLGAIPALREGG